MSMTGASFISAAVAGLGAVREKDARDRRAGRGGRTRADSTNAAPHLGQMGSGRRRS
jgi:hypothetical protein